MSPYENNALHFLHVVGLFVMAVYTFWAFAAPQESRKRVLMVTGIASLIVVLTGIRMWQGLFSFEMLGWIWVKLVCWFALSGLTGMAYRRREKAKALMTVTLSLVVVAVAMVYLKPF